MRKFREHQQRSSSETVDLWEHACLLYHSYGWQSAADAFLQLEQHTSDLEDKCVFAMNKGLTEARLGDLDDAMASFTKALEYDEGNHVAHFLLGLAHAGVRNYANAKTQFEHCLKCLDTNDRGYSTHMGSFSLDTITVQENIDHMRSRLIAMAAGYGRISHLRTRLNILPAEVLFEPPSRSTRTSQRNTTYSTDQGLSSRDSQDSYERLQGPVSRATQPFHVPGYDVQSLHLVEDAEKNLTIAPPSDTVNNARGHKKLAPRDPRVQDGSMQELAQFLRHAGPSGDANVTVDRKYMQRLLQGNRHDRTLSRYHNQISESRDEFDSLLGLYTRASSTRRLSIPATIDSSVSDAPMVRKDGSPERTTSDGDESPLIKRERSLRSRRPTLESARRWLHKEDRPPGPYELADSDRLSASARAAREHLRGATLDDDGDEKSLPSVVSSTEMFTFGRPRT